MGTFLPSWVRTGNIVLGVLAFILSLVVIAEPGFGNAALVVLLYVALFVRGVAGLALGTAGKQVPAGLRALSSVVGVLSIILSFVYLAFPLLAIGTLIFLLSIGLLVTGLEAIAAGVIGRNIVPVIAGQVKP